MEALGSTPSPLESASESLTYCLRASPDRGGGVKAHETHVRLLVGGLLGQPPLKGLDCQRQILLPTLLVKPSELDKQGKKPLPELPSAALRPSS